MKKVLSVALALIMILSLATIAFAAPSEQELTGDGNTAEQSAEVKIGTVESVGAEWYSVEIPADQTIDWESPDVVDVSYRIAAQLKSGKHISVKVESGNGYELKKDGSEYSLPYNHNGFGVDKSFGSSVGAGTKEAPEYYELPTAERITLQVADGAWSNVAIDTYSDTLTYTVSVA